MAEALVTDVPLIGFVAAHSNSGKTTLIEQLIPLLANHGVKCAVIKHVHHDFDMDTPGKDSYRFREAGARQVIAGSVRRAVLQVETGEGDDYPDLQRLVNMLDQRAIDLIVVEGFRRYPFPRIETTLADSAEELVCRDDEDVIAVASKQQLADLPVPQLRLDDTPAIADFICEWMKAKVML